MQVLSCFLQRKVKSIFAAYDEFPPAPSLMGTVLSKWLMVSAHLLWMACSMNALDVVLTLKKVPASMEFSIAGRFLSMSSKSVDKL